MAAARAEPAFRLYPYRRVPAQGRAPVRHPVVVVGAGPVGLGLALDLGSRGTPVLVLDDQEGPGAGSKAICFAKRTLDIAHRLGAGRAMVEKGVVWNVGRVFRGAVQVFEFDLLPEGGHRNPAFVNLQQPYVETFLHDAIRAAQARGAPIELRGHNRVAGLEPRTESRTQSRSGPRTGSAPESGPDADHVAVRVETPDGPYRLEADWLVACDGARSPTRDMLGLGFRGRVFEDNFLIADVRMRADFPTERRFWFDPPFAGAGPSALLHKQPDDLWRLDFQLGWEIDRAAELLPERVCARIDAMLSNQSGRVPDYDLVWCSIYNFGCRRMERFRHGRIFFAGDSAHQVSPFGARGANSGLQDAENLAWKLDLVLKGRAPEALLDSYNSERGFAADENILNSSRATDFMTPKSGISRLFRDAVLDLAREHAFARPFVNSGRLSVPCTYDGFPQFATDALDGPARTRPGSACCDAPVGEGFLLDHLGGDFCVLSLGGKASDAADQAIGGQAPNAADQAIGGQAPNAADPAGLPLRAVHIAAPSPELAARYLGGAERAVYLIRPDQHVVARWPAHAADRIAAALAAALATAPGQE